MKVCVRCNISGMRRSVSSPDETSVPHKRRVSGQLPDKEGFLTRQTKHKCYLKYNKLKKKWKDGSFSLNITKRPEKERGKFLGLKSFFFLWERWMITKINEVEGNCCLVQCFRNTEKRVENTTHGEVFLTNFEVFHLVMKHCVECLILLLKQFRDAKMSSFSSDFHTLIDH